MYKQFPSLAEAFLNYFDVDLVTSDDMAARTARVRYRVYCEEFGFEAADCSHQELRTFSMVGIAAFLATFALASLSGRTKIFAMMESNLPRLLRRAGILVQQSDDVADYHGQRAAYFITTELALLNMRKDLHVLYDAIREHVAISFETRAHVA